MRLAIHLMIRNPESAIRNSTIYPNGGEGRTRTFEAARATDLQSAAFDRFATSPAVCVWKRVRSGVPMYADGAGEGI